MSDEGEKDRTLADDEVTLKSMGYAQELARRMSGFSNFAISLSIICILAGGITSFQMGFCTVGGASIGLCWPLVCLFSLMVALTMGQVASAFPTAGGLYHWASILGGKGWGWITAWFNLAGLITVLAAINAGTYDFFVGAFQIPTGAHPEAVKAVGICVITLSQAMFNHRGIRITTLLTDFSGWLILVVAALLTGFLLWKAPGLQLGRLLTFSNYTGEPGNGVVPRTESIAWAFALGSLLPAYTITGFDASAHTSEETVGAAVNVPRGIVRSVLVSGLFGWAMLIAIVLAMPDLNAAAAQGNDVVPWTLRQALSPVLAKTFFVGIGVAQYLCGLATVTSASRMAYAFARDGGLPFSGALRHVSEAHRTPAVAIWTVSILAILFMVFIPYATIAAVCAVFLYISYVLPTAIGFFTHGRSWTAMGPWQIGRWYRPLAALSVVGCLALIVIGMQPPNQQAVWIVGGAFALLTLAWFGGVRRRFQGPPATVLSKIRPS
ncbi:MAG TPA: amino acid permease [Planctomycetota bacterium]|nr:amino acid permease [Planctomycetota bacterium]